MLFGEHAVVYGHPCIVTAMDQRMYVTLWETTGEHGKVVIDTPDLGETEFVFSFDDERKIEEFPKEVRFLVALLRRVGQQALGDGYQLTTKSDFSHLFGFGSSSAVTVAAATAFNEALSLGLNKKQLFDICYQSVIDVQKVGSGFDLAAAIWGKTIFFFPGGKKIEPLPVDSLPLTVVYTGVKADTVTLVQKVGRFREKEQALVDGIFSKMESIVGEARAAIRQNNWLEVGSLMNENHELLVKLDVSSPEIEVQRDNLLASGALGAKLSGAGGGDCVIGVGPVDQEKLLRLVSNSGGHVLNVQPNAPSARVEA